MSDFDGADRYRRVGRRALTYSTGAATRVATALSDPDSARRCYLWGTTCPAAGRRGGLFCKAGAGELYPASSHLTLSLRSAVALTQRQETELLNRQCWRTRIELADAIFEYIEASTTDAVATLPSTG